MTWSAGGRLLEASGTGTAVIIAPIGRISFKGKVIALQKHESEMGPVGRSFWERLLEIQRGIVECGLECALRVKRRKINDRLFQNERCFGVVITRA
jgi:branched-chain amino acid aminotransferase